MFSQFKKVDGCYWVQETSTSKVGYKTLHDLFGGEFYYGYIAMALFGLSAVCYIIAGVLALISK
jgi:hypothetical protein